MKKLKLLLNHGNIENEINDHLHKLQRLPTLEYGKAAAEIGECVAKIHSHDLAKSKLPLYGAEWVMGLVRGNQSCECRDDIIAALEYMGKVEYYNPMDTVNLKEKHFISWDIDSSRWQGEYSSGHIGSFIWDMAAIINHADDPSFSDVFLDSYISHGGKKPTLAALHANLYYVQVAQAAANNDFEGIKQTTKEITEQVMFKTELIPYETIVRLGIDGF